MRFHGISVTKYGDIGDDQLAPQGTPALEVGGVVHFFYGEQRAYIFASHTQAYCSLDKQLAKAIESLDGTSNLDQVLQNLTGENGEGRVEFKAAVDLLYNCGIIRDTSEVSPREMLNKERARERRRRSNSPMLTLALTSGCNLGCAYCYASAAENPKNMDRETWEGAIDFFVGQWIGQCHTASLCFHGGGEPTLDPRRLMEVVEYFQRRCDNAWIKPQFILQTNGAFAPILREFLIQHDIHLSVSLDGDAIVQDYQRPFINGKSSFDRIIENIKYVTKHSRRVGILSTVTSWSLSRMLDTVEMARECGISSIKFAPIEITGRAKKKGMDKPDMEIFAANLIDCIRLGAKYGISVTASVSCDTPIRNSFCGVAHSQPIVTPEGHITTCVEVLEDSDPLAKTFFIGSVGKPKSVEGKPLIQIESASTDQKPKELPIVQLDVEQMEKLSKRRLKYIPNCDACFLKRQCVGGCPAQSLRQEGGDIYTLDEAWCKAMRTVSEATIRMRADGQIDPIDKFERREITTLFAQVQPA